MKRDEKLDEIFAVADLDARARAGDAESQYLMWMLHQKGSDATSITAADAFRYLQLAAEQGYAKANFRLGEICLKTKIQPGLWIDSGRDKAESYFRKAALAFSSEVEKDAESCLFLSALYEAGLGVKRNEKIARELLEQSAELGNEVAIRRLRGEDLDPARLLGEALLG